VNILVHVHYFAFMKEYPQDKFLKVVIGSNGIYTCFFFIICVCVYIYIYIYIYIYLVFI